MYKQYEDVIIAFFTLIYCHCLAFGLPDVPVCWNFMSEKTKILIVEDNDFVRAQVARFLLDDGHAVIEAPDALQALEKIKQDKEITLSIVDVRMEPMDGFEFLRTVRGLGLETSVVLVTGDHNPDLLNEANK